MTNFGAYFKWDDSSKTGEWLPYPPIIVAIARAILDAQNEALDGHVRKTAWEEAQDPRYGLYQAAVAAYKVCNPGFEL